MDFLTFRKQFKSATNVDEMRNEAEEILQESKENEVTKSTGVYHLSAGGESERLLKKAQAGLLGNYLLGSTGVIFFPSFSQHWTHTPILLTLNKNIQLEFGKIRDSQDESDLRRMGIRTTNASHEEFKTLIVFLEVWITKSKDPAILNKAFKKLIKSGIVFSAPDCQLTRDKEGGLIPKVGQATVPLSIVKMVSLKPNSQVFICPRCEFYFRVINSQSIIGTCPKCATQIRHS